MLNNKIKIWNKIFTILINVDEDKKKEILNIIIKKNDINNQIFLLLIKKFDTLFKTLSLEEIYYIFNKDNKISSSTLAKQLDNKLIIKSINLYIENHINKNHIFKNINFLFKTKIIEYYIEKKIQYHQKFSLKEKIYLLNNYQLSKENIEYLINLEELSNELDDPFYIYDTNKFENIKNISDINNKDFYLILYLKQKKLNSHIKNKIINKYYLILKEVIDYSINIGDFKLLKEFLYLNEYIEEELLNNYYKMVKKYLDNINDINENPFYNMNIENIQEIISIYMYLNKEYRENNDIEYFLELNLDKIDFFEKINYEELLNVLESFIYEDNIDKSITVLKILIKLKNKNILIEEESLKNTLKNPFFYDHNELIKIDFRNIFIEIFNTFNLKLDKNDEEDFRIILNMKYLYEKIYYEKINIENIKYISYDIKNISKLFHFLYKNNLIEKFLSSHSISNYNFKILKNIIINYIDKINKDIGYTTEDKKSRKYQMIKNLLKNKELDKNYHFKLYMHYQNEESLRERLLNNENLSIIVIFKSSSNLKDIKYIINSKTLYLF